MWGQCSKLLQNKLKASTKFNEMDTNSNVAELLQEIKALSNRTDENTSTHDALHKAKAKLFRYQQSDGEALANHMQNFKDLCNGVEYYNGDVFFDKDMVQAEIKADAEKDIGPISNDEN